MAGSKNNPNTRGKPKDKICGTCETPKTPIMFSGAKSGKSKISFQCKCGIIDKNGVLLWKE